MTRLQIIRAAIAILFPADQTIEVRAYNKRRAGMPYVRRFSDYDAAAEAIADLSASGDWEGIYYTLNMFPSDTVFAKATDAVRNEQVTHRIWLFFDFDAERPKHPAEFAITTDDTAEMKVEKRKQIEAWKHAHGNADAVELGHAKDACMRIKNFLSACGWSEPVVCFSGNGYHLLYAIDIAASPETDELIKQVTDSVGRVLAEMFRITACKVDSVVANRARITKAYGTLTQKGKASTDRPHRYSQMLTTHQPEVVSIEQLQSFAAMFAVPAAPKPLTTSPAPANGKVYSTNDANDGINDEKTIAEMIRFLETYGVPHLATRRGYWKGASGWLIDIVCPWSIECHGGSVDGRKDSTIFIPDKGRWEYNCFHAHCDNIRSWSQLREKVSAGKPFTFACGEPSGQVFVGRIVNAEILDTDLQGKVLLVTDEAGCMAASSVGIPAIGVHARNHKIASRLRESGAHVVLAFNNDERGQGLRKQWAAAMRHAASGLTMPERITVGEYITKKSPSLRKQLGLELNGATC